MKKQLCAILWLALSGMALLGGCHMFTPQDTGRDLLSEVKSVNKLVLAQMAISKMATIDDIDLSKAEGLKQTTAGLIDAIKLGNRKAAYSYNTYLRATIDLSAMTEGDIQVNKSAKTITITLPPVQTEFIGRDMEIREDHYRVTGLRSKINAKERAELKEQMNAMLKHEVEVKPEFRNRLEAEARAKCDSYFRNLLAKDGYSVIINFK